MRAGLEGVEGVLGHGRRGRGEVAQEGGDRAEALARRAGLAARILGRQTSPRRPRIRSVRTELTMSGACEATVLLEEGDRVRAAAARLELLRERWILTGLEMA